MSKFIAFLQDVRVELAKVAWPTRQETIRYTLVVIALSVAVALFLGAFDKLFQYILKIII